jgi:hypothetical protein
MVAAAIIKMRSQSFGLKVDTAMAQVGRPAPVRHPWGGWASQPNSRMPHFELYYRKSKAKRARRHFWQQLLALNFTRFLLASLR